MPRSLAMNVTMSRTVLGRGCSVVVAAWPKKRCD